MASQADVEKVWKLIVDAAHFIKIMLVHSEIVSPRAETTK